MLAAAGPGLTGSVLRLLLVPSLLVLLVLLALRTPRPPSASSQLSSPFAMDFVVDEINPQTTKFRLVDRTTLSPVPFSVAMDHLAELGSTLQNALISLLRDSRHRAFFWECPPVTSASLTSTPFEFVIIDAKRLEDVSPDPNSFAAHFSSEEGISVFPNLGKDATLVVPSPRNAVSPDAYTHLANFVRMAPVDQVQQLFSRCAQAVLSRLQDAPHSQKLWLSTSGLGVYWLHIRLDSVPKYYNWVEYKTK